MTTPTQPRAAPTREILRPFYERVRKHFNGDYTVVVELSLQHDKGDAEDEFERAVYGHCVSVDYQSFKGRTLEEAFANAELEFIQPNPAAEEAAKKLEALAEAVRKGEKPIPENI